MAEDLLQARHGLAPGRCATGIRPSTCQLLQWHGGGVVGTTQEMGIEPEWPISDAEWLTRCCIRVLELDARLAERDAKDLARDLFDRPSCRALAPERAADLLFQNRLSPSGWRRLSEVRAAHPGAAESHPERPKTDAA
jgi:hypothetical protein